MATGQRGFKQRQIGEWLPYGTLQIIGLGASQHTATDVITFTISKDGNTITSQEGKWVETYYRQQ
jgi:hypothetical protein